MPLGERVRAIEDAAARPRPSAATLARVDALFEREGVRRPGTLHDGKLFSVSEAAPDALRGWYADYRWWVAQRADASLADELRVRPLAVTGLVRAGGAVLLGQRSARVFEGAGRWELAPSGGVGAEARDASGEPSLVQQVLLELREEIALGREQVTRARPLALVVDEASGVLDVCIELSLGLTRAAFARHAASTKSDEYAALACVDESALASWAAQAGDLLDPVSRAALEFAGLLPCTPRAQGARS
jgi:hypothetical protein